MSKWPATTSKSVKCTILYLSAALGRLQRH